MENDRFQNPVGIGGWLLIPLGMFIMAIGQGLLGLLGLGPHDFAVFDVIAVLFAIWSLRCVYLILKRSPKVRYACANYFLVCAICAVLCLIGVTGESGFQIDPSSLVAAVWFSVWVVYFLKSKRVANTFSGSGIDVLKKRSRDSETEMDVSKFLVRRFAARVTDMAIMAIVLLVMLCIITGHGLFGNVDLLWPMGAYFVTFFFFGCGVIVVVAMDFIVYPLFKQTLGKWLFGLRVVTEEGENLTRRQWMFRNGNCLYYRAWPVLLVTPLVYGAPSVHYSLLHLWLWFLLMVLMVIWYQCYKVLTTGRTSYDVVYGTSVVGESLSGRHLGRRLAAVFGLIVLLVFALFR